MWNHRKTYIPGCHYVRHRRMSIHPTRTRCAAPTYVLPRGYVLRSRSMCPNPTRIRWCAPTVILIDGNHTRRQCMCAYPTRTHWSATTAAPPVGRVLLRIRIGLDSHHIRSREPTWPWGWMLLLPCMWSSFATVLLLSARFEGLYMTTMLRTYHLA